MVNCSPQTELPKLAHCFLRNGAFFDQGSNAGKSVLAKKRAPINARETMSYIVTICAPRSAALRPHGTIDGISDL